MKRLHNSRWLSEYKRLRRERAAEVDAPRALRTVQQQLDIIAKRPGNSAKETKRLMEQL